jgi:hypothetical protein
MPSLAGRGHVRHSDRSGVAAAELQTYRGLSGLDSALYVTAAVNARTTLWSQQQRPWAVAAFVSIAALGAKVAYELTTGQTLFVDAASEGFVPVPLAHAAGAIAGLLAARPALSRYLLPGV